VKTSVLILTCALCASTAPAGDICKITAKAVLKTCTTEAKADYKLALAKCANLTDPEARKACQAEAKEALAEAIEECKEQAEARLDACERLGPDAYDPAIDPSNFAAMIDNPYFPLTPGTTYIYEGQADGGFEHSEFAVTTNTRVILGVTCIEVRDTVYTDGELTEDTLDWFAQDLAGNVWYFGENTYELEDGLIATLEGSFMAGVNGDKPGIVMKAQPMIGDFYRQEFSLNNAEDYAETLSLTATTALMSGTYTNCVQSQETTPLEPELLEHKYYAPGVGNVLTVDVNTGDRVELIQVLTN